MNKSLIAFATCMTLIIFSCKKDDFASTSSSQDKISELTVPVSDLSAKGVVEDVHWEGLYDDSSETGGDPDTHTTDQGLIHNGVAHVNNPYPVGYSHIFLTMPSDRFVQGDSLICQTSIQNPMIYSTSPYDVIIYLNGSQHDLTVHLVGDASGLQQTSYTIGNQTYTAIPKLVTSFSNFVTLKVSTKKGQTGIYINGKLAFSAKYIADNKLGIIQGIELSGRGAPYVDYVKFTNSVTNKKIMTEDFNVEGESHVVFY